MNLFDDLIYVGIVGSRRRELPSDMVLVEQAFRKVYVPGKTVIVSGGCPKGADHFAEYIAAQLGLPRDERISDAGSALLQGPRIIIHYPDVEAFSTVPPRWRSTRANYSRNELIARDSRDHLIACVGPDRKGGTENTIQHFRRIHRKEPILV
jgi:hypothetical protein